MKATVANIWLGGHNNFMDAICMKALELVKDVWQIETPELFVDILQDWIGANYENYPSCKPDSMRVLYRKLRTGPEIRIYCERGRTLVEAMRIAIDTAEENNTHKCPTNDDLEKLSNWAQIIRSYRYGHRERGKRTGKVKVEGGRIIPGRFLTGSENLA